jgi:hypothetical protein
VIFSCTNISPPPWAGNIKLFGRYLKLWLGKLVHF